MSFFSEKVLKRPPAEEIKGYSLREIEIARKNYNYGHNVCFYTVLVFFIIWAILCSVFRPSVAHASELVSGEIDLPVDNYCVLSNDGGYVWVFVNFNNCLYANKSITGRAKSFSSVDSAVEYLKSDFTIDDFSSTSSTVLGTVYYCNVDLLSQDGNDVVFQLTPLTSTLQVGGLAAPEIAKATVIQILGLVPLVLGLVVSAIGLRKASAMVFQRLRRA